MLISNKEVYMRVLSQHETLEKMLSFLKKELRKPVFLVSCQRKDFTALYTLPDKEGLFSVDELELFLSPFAKKHIGKLLSKKENYFKYERPCLTTDIYELIPADMLYFVYPADSSIGYSNATKSYVELENIGIEFNRTETVHIKNENFPPELAPYVKTGFNFKEITFSVSERIMRPDISLDSWHISLLEDFVTFLPPGKYNSKTPISEWHDFNRYVITECKPGPCIACHGLSGEKIHFATVALYRGTYNKENAIPINRLCKTCAKQAFAQWQDCLDRYN